MAQEENGLVEENTTAADTYYQVCELIDEMSYRNPSIDPEKFSKLKSYYQGDTRSLAEIKTEINRYLMELDEKEEKDFGPAEQEQTDETYPEQEKESEEKESEEKEEPKHAEEDSTENGSTADDSEEEYEETEEKEVTMGEETETNPETVEESEVYEGLRDAYEVPGQQVNTSQESEIYEGLLDAYQIPGQKPLTDESKSSSELGDMFNSYESFSRSESAKDNATMGFEKPKQFVKSFDSGNNEGGYSDVVAMSMLTTAAIFSIITIILAIAIIA